MKKILQRLIRIFPNKHISIEKEYGKYVHIDDITLRYKLYIANVDPAHTIFDSLQELDKYCTDTYDNYKSVYK